MRLKNKYFVTFIVFISIMSLFGFTASIEYNRSYQNNLKYTKDKLLLIKLNLESLISSRMIALNGLKAHAEIDPNFTQDDFNYFAKEIYNSSNDVVQSMSFLTDTTISHIYPYDDYKDIVGTDLSLNPEQKEWINYAKNTLKPIITAPVNLVEGGLGIIVRVPVGINNQYYGQVSIVFDYDKILSASGLIELSEDYYIKLIKLDEINDKNHIIWTNDDSNINLNSKESVLTEVNLYESKIILSAVPKTGYKGNSHLFYLILFVGIIIASISSGLIFKLKKNQEHIYKQYKRINKQKEYIKLLADRDYLTNLYNRRRFIEDIGGYISSNKSGTVLLFDIDNFKNINDTQGHHYGDLVLKHIGNLLNLNLCKNSSLYRIGGDEFAIHLPGVIDNIYIESCIDSFFKALKENNSISNIKNNITASVGIAKYPLDSRTADDILMKSDIAMYQAKKDGKNRYCYFTEELISNFDFNVRIENELRDALDMNKFKLLYQPVIDSKTNEISSFEALLRIQDSIISPSDFIPVAESTGLIIPIGDWIIEQVCKQLYEWKENGIQIKPVAINISARQLYEGSILSNIKEILDRYKLPTDLIEIEVTESILINNSEQTIDMLQKLRDIGILISLDDFGTGYSSLSYLTYIPVDKVKIDKSLKDKFLFIENEDVMKGIISICHGLNLKVVTEGVESEEEFEQLKKYSSDYVQGYYFDKPLSFKNVTTLLKENHIY